MNALALFAVACAPALPQDRQETHVPDTLPTAAEIAELPADGGPEFNRLVFEKSPYLLQHARNPVDWYPWGEEAFRAAAARNKPIFLSIGYSTCHWCHVMEHESFEDEDVARLLNDAFVCVKVDREERPDLDHVYMTITQAMNDGHGGWPMTVVMTPDKKPFFAGTYFPKSGRYGRWGMVDLVPRLAEMWAEKRDEIVAHADRVTEQLGQMMQGSPGGALDPGVAASAYSQIASRFDARHGGFGGAPKFPLPHNLRFLLRHHAREGDARALEMVQKTLVEMRKGGVWDHVGFGFHRYSTDAEWLVPHFEKMLYDQALMAMALVEAWLVTGDDQHRRTAREILAYVTRDMTSPEGGFYSAEDADSEGEEGLFYLWTTAELAGVLGEEDAAFAASVWNATEEGNYADEATGKKTGRNILHLRRSLDELAAEREDPAAFLARVEDVRRRLFDARERRVHPLKDDKVLTDWNGLMIAAFAQAARAFDDAEYAATARRAADHLLTRLRREDGGLYKLARLGEAAGDGMLEDYTFAAWGLVELFQTVQDPRYLGAALELTDRMVADFRDAEHGGFFLSPADGEELIVRPKEVYDGAIPSGNSVAVWNLLRLSALTGRAGYAEEAQTTIQAFSGDLARAPSAHTQLLVAHDFELGPRREIVIAGERSAQDTEAMLRAVHARFAPNDVVLLRAEGESDALAALVPFVAEQGMVDGKTTAYVCRDFACQAPTNDLAELREALRAGVQEDAAEGSAEGER